MTTHALCLRLARPWDAIGLQSYFRRLSKASRQSRFLGGISDVPLDSIMHAIGVTAGDLFSMVALSDAVDHPGIVGEAVCSMAEDAEVALSVACDLQGCGIGRALLSAIEAQAMEYGARRIHGHVRSHNDAVRKLAVKCGYTVERTVDDWSCCILRKPLAFAAVHPDRLLSVKSAETEPVSSRRRAAASAAT